MSARRHLTKSRFKVGYDCPTKLYFLDNKEFGNKNVDDTFLKALAEGGFQVGELAKQYFPGGVDIRTLNKEDAVRQTSELLKQDSVVIYEAAIEHKNLFIRADILVKQGARIDIIEVKAKSYDPSEENQFYNKNSLKKGPKKLSSTWEPYLIDVAFQCHVVKLSRPEAEVSGSLVLADKSASSTVDGLNQKFFLERTPDGRTSIRVQNGLCREDLGEALLVRVPVDGEISLIAGSKFYCAGLTMSFTEMINFLAKTCVQHSFVTPPVGTHCKSCEFRIGNELKTEGLKSGFEHCWSEAEHLTDADFSKEFVFDIWNFRRAASLLSKGKIFAEDIEESDVITSDALDTGTGLSSAARQWIQVEKIRTKDLNPYFDEEGLAAEMRKWKFPLNFIDFETTMAALPFHKGRRPYEQIAFQFSHHTVTDDGKITHENEYINSTRGEFPNFLFARALKEALEKNDGTIFRYATHENTVLRQIRKQLMDSQEPPKDRDDLIEFIETVTASESDPEDQWVGVRNMVDMCELVKKFYYHPLTGGSNSIKKVLPSILSTSSYLQKKYYPPVYGADNGIKSRNFQNWKWIQFDQGGKVIDPYKLLPPVFSDLSLEVMDSLITEGSIADGGAAMTAYARVQFSQMSKEETEFVVAALLKYCELDTFAMVLIYEYWKDAIDSAAKKVA